MSRQNPNKKDLVLYVSDDLIGLSPAQRVNEATSIGGNSALRFDWGTIDRFRGVTGNYFTKLQSSTGASSISFLAPLSPNQKKILSIERKDSTDDGKGKKQEEYIVTLNNDAWNDFTYAPEDQNIRDLLTQINFGNQQSIKGDPFWRYYMLDGFPEGEVLSTDMTFQQLPSVFSNKSSQGAAILDHTFRFYKASNNVGTRVQSGLDIRVDAKYNFFVDSTPPYENVTQLVSEPMITNFYCLRSELENTGSELRSLDYFNQITVNNLLQETQGDQRDVWFDVNVEAGVNTYTESTTAQYYSLYSKKVNFVTTERRTQLATTFSENYKDIVILCSDVDLMRDAINTEENPTTTANLPFYNKIFIGKDQDSVYKTDASQNHFFLTLYEQMDSNEFASFMNILQLYIINSLKTGRFDKSTEFKKFSLQPQELTETPLPMLEDETINLGVHWNDFLELASQANLSPTAATANSIANRQSISSRINSEREPINNIEDNTSLLEYTIKRINNAINDKKDNYILLRDYRDKDGQPLKCDIKACQIVLDKHQSGKLKYPHRDFEQVLANESSYSEPILYKIDKKDEEGTILQTFYISARDRRWNQRDITYIDSQVKYSKKYTYDIRQIRMVFGNEYSYNNVQLFYASEDNNMGPGRIIGKALGFYPKQDPKNKTLFLRSYVEERLSPKRAMLNEDISSVHEAIVQDGQETETTAAKGYYVFHPDPDKVTMGADQYRNLIENGTSWYTPSSAGQFDTTGNILSLMTISLDASQSEINDHRLASSSADFITTPIIVAPPESLPDSSDFFERQSKDENQIDFNFIGNVTRLANCTDDISSLPYWVGNYVGEYHDRILALQEPQDKLEEWEVKYTRARNNVFTSGPLRGKPKDPLALAFAGERVAYWQERVNPIKERLAQLRRLIDNEGYCLEALDSYVDQVILGDAGR